ncbi:hypothetical protein QJS10_CPA05g01089 [Acorus calamus]|uniref:Uncharacterized protein n=1 Tax=Acorus calamus TaxID=4465 RepID=A0AAV9ETE8_ACOCL|nr:hypothetical protein QJS10_CPA05g01089 [Acorus calamus]
MGCQELQILMETVMYLDDYMVVRCENGDDRSQGWCRVHGDTTTLDVPHHEGGKSLAGASRVTFDKGKISIVEQYLEVAYLDDDMVVRCDAETEVDHDGMVQKMTEVEDGAKRIQEEV